MNKERMEDFNGWWFSGRVHEDLLQAYKRDMFHKLVGDLGKRQMLSIVGLRRTGKTTLMFQMIEHLLGGGLDKSNILYFNFDEYAESLDEVLDTYRQLQRKDLRLEKTYVFLDEIQKLGGWPDQIKKYYDLYPKVKFVISGSESLFISTGTKETLAGRLREFTLSTLSFKEFMGIRGVKPEAPITQRKALFTEYVENGGFPEMIGKDKAEIREYVKSIVLDKVIYKDIVKLFGIKDTDALRQIIEIIASNPGMYLEYNSLAQKLGKDRRSIRNYVALLEESFLVRLMGNYRKGRAASVRKVKRIYPSDNSIITAFKSLIDDDFMGKMVETAVVNNLQPDAFWKNSHEVDIVLEGNPIEVKYQNMIISKDMEGLREFMRKFSAKEGVLLTKNEEKNVSVGEGQIHIIPVWKFLSE